jgi:membrane associated rhomboid family serine protease
MLRERSAGRPRDVEDDSIATSRVSLDAPGLTAKEILVSDDRGRKVQVEHHLKNRRRSRPPSVEERNPRASLDAPERRASTKMNASMSPVSSQSRMSSKKAPPREEKPERHESKSRNMTSEKLSPQRTSDVVAPRENPPKRMKRASRSPSKHISREHGRSRSSSPRKFSTREPLLESGKEFSRNKQLNTRIRSLKLRLLDDHGAPIYKPPVIPDSGDDASSSNGDKYSFKGTSRDSVRLASQSEYDRETRSCASKPTAAVPGSMHKAEIQAEKKPLAHTSKDIDGVLESPTRATSFSGSVKTRHSLRDLDSGLFVTSHSDDVWSSSEDGVVILKQRVAYLCIAISIIQLGLLTIQLCLCGFASLKINPMIGPYPDAFSEWGGKNTYLLLEGQQYFRIITPIFLHVGVIHLLINVYCQLETCAFLEREWGSSRWLVIYVISGIGSVLTASAIDPDVIGVCSSGALMGMFGAKIAQVLTWTNFELKSSILEESARFDTLGGVMCSAAIISLLSFFTYIDWSGHLGGLFAGFFVGMTLFAKPIASRSKRAIWASLGMMCLIIGGIIVITLLFHTDPDEELGDACQYFRNLYPEWYVCECVWD